MAGTKNTAQPDTNNQIGMCSFSRWDMVISATDTYTYVNTYAKYRNTYLLSGLEEDYCL